MVAPAQKDLVDPGAVSLAFGFQPRQRFVMNAGGFRSRSSIRMDAPTQELGRHLRRFGVFVERAVALVVRPVGCFADLEWFSGVGPGR